tara:strand:- start:71 stop:175 length:105 start_codon:yes stop_codon:yes gene_type:complete
LVRARPKVQFLPAAPFKNDKRIAEFVINPTQGEL